MGNVKYDSHMQKSFDHRNTFHAYASIFMLALAAALVTYLYWNLMLPRKGFYNNLWGPVYFTAWYLCKCRQIVTINISGGALMVHGGGDTCHRLENKCEEQP